MNTSEALEQLIIDAYPGKVIQRVPFVYPVVFTAVAAGATNLQQTFQVNGDADFILLATGQHTSVGYAAQTITSEVIPNASVQLTDGTNNRTLFSAACDLATIFGSSQTPFFWPQPYLLPANTTVLVQLNSLEAAQVDTIQLSFIGVKVIYGGDAPAPSLDQLVAQALQAQNNLTAALNASGVAVGY